MSYHLKSTYKFVVDHKCGTPRAPVPPPRRGVPAAALRYCAAGTVGVVASAAPVVVLWAVSSRGGCA
ncbi:unnamed protein product [Anisakis simplex]|uniref:Uncharacterized protein n=1 Tax=Anisakis simplex TaxID=6269 RepID=A0A0M3K525_ANISI|nr:unnamed protein product [Anisakis simplex]